MIVSSITNDTTANEIADGPKPTARGSSLPTKEPAAMPATAGTATTAMRTRALRTGLRCH
jgi:hypothetical protein